MRRRDFTLAAAGLALPDLAWAQPGPSKPADPLTQKPPSVAEAIGRVSSTGRYLPLLEAAEYEGRLPDRGMQNEASQAFCMVGEEQRALQRDEAMRKVGSADADKRAEAEAFVQPLHPVPAVEAIVERIRGRQIVMINEAHCVSRHRAFTAALAVRLAKEGFTWFAAETFQPLVAGLHPGLPFTGAMGLYSNDPVFAEAVRRIRDAGYRFAAYDGPDPGQVIRSDDPVEGYRQREERAARHLVETIFVKDPKARVLIHVGYGHLVKHSVKLTPTSEPVPNLAQKLQELTGIEPFCIDQTLCTPASTPELDLPVVAAILRQFPLTEPVVMRRADGAAPRMYDVAEDEWVFHPRVSDVMGRPGWRTGAPGVRAVPFDTRHALAKDCRLMQALRVEELEGVPADILVLKPTDTRIALMLPRGHYRFRGEGAAGFTDLGEVRV